MKLTHSKILLKVKILETIFIFIEFTKFNKIYSTFCGKIPLLYFRSLTLTCNSLCLLTKTSLYYCFFERIINRENKSKSALHVNKDKESKKNI